MRGGSILREFAYAAGARAPGHTLWRGAAGGLKASTGLGPRAGRMSVTSSPMGSPGEPNGEPQRAGAIGCVCITFGERTMATYFGGMRNGKISRLFGVLLSSGRGRTAIRNMDLFLPFHYSVHSRFFPAAPWADGCRQRGGRAPATRRRRRTAEGPCGEWSPLTLPSGDGGKHLDKYGGGGQLPGMTK